jgi:ParB family chromosome partitioning protein
MELHHVPLAALRLAPINVRHGKRKPPVADLIPSIRSRGILQPLLVRPNGEGFEVVAGRRRLFAVAQIAEEDGAVPEEVLLPCGVMHDGDNASALEASLIENVTHLPMDDMDQYEAFARLERQGRTVPEIAQTFGVTDLTVKRRLALGTLSPKIRDAYRQDLIDGETLKLLTLASKRQQKEWLDLLEQESGAEHGGVQRAPRAWQLRSWLFGGERIASTAALFPLERYTGALITDFFGEESYFADREAFWALQNEAIASLRDELLAKRWTNVVVLGRGERFQRWQHAPVAKKDGGKVYIEVRESGEVEVHEGFLDQREVRARDKAKSNAASDEGMVASARPELTSAAQSYVALHRHAIVRTALLKKPGVAFRLAVAHIIAGSPLWSVKPDSQEPKTEEIAESIRTSPAQAAFEAERAEVLGLLDLEPSYRGTVVRSGAESYVGAQVFARLLALSDKEVRRVLAFVMAETLAVGCAFVEAAGAATSPDASGSWQADETFLDLIRDRGVVNAMLAEVAGETVANGNVTETAKLQKKIIFDCLTGNGREKVDSWLPAYLSFPLRSYTPDRSFGLLERWNEIAPLFETA